MHFKREFLVKVDNWLYHPFLIHQCLCNAAQIIPHLLPMINVFSDIALKGVPLHAILFGFILSPKEKSTLCF